MNKGGSSRLYDRGVGQYAPKGYTSTIGLYMDKDRVWGHSRDMTIYMDNFKIGDANTTFGEMSHDGSSFGGPPGQTESAPPRPPQLIAAE
jgi:hypothetical protein